MVQSIGFIGIGVMGESMCGNLIKALGKPINVFDMNSAQVEKMVGLGAKACTSAVNVVEQSDIVFIMVATNEQIESVIYEILPALTSSSDTGSKKILVNMATISPSIQKILVKKIKDSTNNAIMVETPVVKSKGAAISGTLGIYAAGNKEIIEKIKPLLLHMGETVIYYGEDGNALTMKLLHNMLVGVIQNGVNELLVVAEKLGLDFELVKEGINAGGGQNFYLDAKTTSIHNGEYSPKFSIKNMTKDVRLHKKMIEQLNVTLPSSDLVRSIYDSAVKNYMDEDFSATYKTVKKKSEQAVEKNEG